MKMDKAELARFENLGLIAKQLVDGFIAGLHKSPYHGFSVEFAEHKLYNPGESIKHIDWKVFARTDKLFTKQYQEETNLRCKILLDHSSSMNYPEKDLNKLSFSIYAAAALSNLLIKQRDAVGLSSFSDEIEFDSDIKSTQSHYLNLLKHLSSIQHDQTKLKSTNITETLDVIAEKMKKRSLIILFSDLFDGDNEERLIAALQHLKHNKHEVILFHVTDHSSELNLEFEDRPYRFIDIETNKSVKVNPAEIRDLYRKEMIEYYNHLKIKCGMLKIDFIPVDVSEPFDKLLGAYLIKRKRYLSR